MASTPLSAESNDAAPGHDLIVLGASAGGVDALKQLIAALPADLPASIFVVMHVHAESPLMLPMILQKVTKLRVASPADHDPIEQGCIYVALPNRHLLVETNQVRVINGPKENRHRPAIDPLFRSAAWAFGPRVVGVVLSGTLDDGTGGLWAVKSCGGIAIVQDPAEAQYPAMPANALRSLSVDHCLPLVQIAGLLAKLAQQPVELIESPHPATIASENEFLKMKRDIRSMDAIGELSAFTCPSCHGALWELQNGNDFLHYRCHVGHAYAPDSLLTEQTERVEEALYSAYRAMEEKAQLARRLSDRFAQNLPRVAADYEAQAAALDGHAAVLRNLIAGTGPQPSPGNPTETR